MIHLWCFCQPATQLSYRDRHNLQAFLLENSFSDLAINFLTLQFTSANIYWAPQFGTEGLMETQICGSYWICPQEAQKVSLVGKSPVNRYIQCLSVVMRMCTGVCGTLFPARAWMLSWRKPCPNCAVKFRNWGRGQKEEWDCKFRKLWMQRNKQQFKILQFQVWVEVH